MSDPISITSIRVERRLPDLPEPSPALRQLVADLCEAQAERLIAQITGVYDLPPPSRCTCGPKRILHRPDCPAACYA